jgi:hypothetical protein
VHGAIAAGLMAASFEIYARRQQVDRLDAPLNGCAMLYALMALMLPQEASDGPGDRELEATEPKQDIISNRSRRKHLVRLLGDVRRNHVDCLS